MTKEGPVVFEWGIFTFYLGGIIQGAIISLRFCLLILMTSLLTLTTTPIEITDAIESLLKPLKKVKFPVHELADRKSTRLNSSHVAISYAVFCLKKKKKNNKTK